jgi:hypothetical protein
MTCLDPVAGPMSLMVLRAGLEPRGQETNAPRLAPNIEKGCLTVLVHLAGRQGSLVQCAQRQGLEICERLVVDPNSPKGTADIEICQWSGFG